MDGLVLKLEELKNGLDKLVDEFPHFIQSTLKKEMGGKSISGPAKQQSEELINICKDVAKHANEALCTAKKIPEAAPPRPPKAVSKERLPEPANAAKCTALKSAQIDQDQTYDDGCIPLSNDPPKSASIPPTEQPYDDARNATSNYDDARKAPTEYDDARKAPTEYDDARKAPTEYDDARKASTKYDDCRKVPIKSTEPEEEVHTGSSHQSSGSTPSTISASPSMASISKSYILDKEPPIKATDIVSPDQKGLLQKMKPRTGTKKKKEKFQMRLFVLKDQKLYYYDNKKLKKQKKCISLEGFAVKPDEQLKSRFHLSKEGVRSFLLVAADETECAQWVHALQRACDVGQAEPEADDGELYEMIEPEVNKSVVPRQDESEEIYDEVGLGLDTVPAPAPPAVTVARAATVTQPEEEETYDDVMPPSARPPAATLKPTNQHPAEQLSNEQLVQHFKKLLEQELVKHEELFYARWSSAADSAHELSVGQGQMLRLRDRARYDAQGWWVCEARGKIGLLPKQYLEPAFELVH